VRVADSWREGERCDLDRDKKAVVTSQPGGPDPVAVGGARVDAVLEIVDEEGGAAGLQIRFVDGSSLVCTVWTDWSLRMEKRADAEIPEYFWPPAGFSHRPMIQDIPEGGLEIMSTVTSTDEFGVVMGVDVEMNGYHVSAQSMGGEVVLSLR
jgi:hypothetical protein